MNPELENVGCCELISEIVDTVEAIEDRPLEEFDAIDVSRLRTIQYKTAKLIEKIVGRRP